MIFSCAQCRILRVTLTRSCAGAAIDISKPLLRCTPTTTSRRHAPVLLLEAMQALLGGRIQEVGKLVDCHASPVTKRESLDDITDDQGEEAGIHEGMETVTTCDADAMRATSAHIENISGKGLYIDGTFGRGGHCKALLQRLPPEARVVAFDIDRVAERVARRLEREDRRLTFHREWADNLPGPAEGVLLDLGVSTEQLFGGRGFSLTHDDLLDLRFDRSQGLAAWQWLARADVARLAKALFFFGEDDDWLLCQRLADAIVTAKPKPPRTSRELGELVRLVKGFDDRGHHPAKLTLQALRMFINRELFRSFRAVRAGTLALRAGGRLVVLAYKRKEVALVKRLLREHERSFYGTRCPRGESLFQLPELELRQVCAPIRPSVEEILDNHRARSAQMWVMEVVKPCAGAQDTTISDFTIARVLH